MSGLHSGEIAPDTALWQIEADYLESIHLPFDTIRRDNFEQYRHARFEPATRDVRGFIKTTIRVPLMPRNRSSSR